MATGPFTIGVEEEFLVVDADTGAIRPDGPDLLPAARSRLGEDVHTELWRRWPTAGTPAPFADRADYEAVVEALFRTGSIDDQARIYWDVRPSAKFPTVEFRVADVGMTVDDTVMMAGLVRALAVAAVREAGAAAGPAVRRVRPELVRAATWR